MARTTAEFLDLVSPIMNEYMENIKKATDGFLEKVGEIPDLTQEELILFESLSKSQLALQKDWIVGK